MIAIFVSAVCYFLLGGLWYSPALFGKAWASLVGMTEEKRRALTRGQMIRAFGGSFVSGLLTSVAVRGLIGIIQPVSFPEVGIIACLVGVGFIVATQATNHLFRQSSIRLFLIEAGFHFFAVVLVFAIMAVEWFQILAG